MNDMGENGEPNRDPSTRPMTQEATRQQRHNDVNSTITQEKTQQDNTRPSKGLQAKTNDTSDQTSQEQIQRAEHQHILTIHNNKAKENDNTTMGNNDHVPAQRTRIGQPHNKNQDINTVEHTHFTQQRKHNEQANEDSTTPCEQRQENDTQEDKQQQQNSQSKDRTHRPTIQQTLPQYDSTPNRNNDAWGASINNLPPTTFRLYFQNINGLQLQSNKSKWQPHLQYMHDKGISISGFAETNANRNYKHIKKKLSASTNSVYDNHSLAFSNNRFNPTNGSLYLPGGCLQLCTGHWTSRIIEEIKDPHRMGRWAGHIDYGREKLYLLLLRIDHATSQQRMQINLQ
jgi:small-conductance mechanosensitive channel